MVIEFIMNCGFGLLELLLSALPNIQWNFDSSILGKFLDFIGIITYLLPMGAILNIMQITIAIITFKIVIATIKTIMDVIPFV